VLTGCDSASQILESFKGESQPQRPVAELSLAVSNRAIDMPWLLTSIQKEGGVVDDYEKNYFVRLRIERDDYRTNIAKFIAREVDAITISNIDAIAQIVRQDIEADVILIAGYSDGNEAILLPEGASPNIIGKPIALEQFSSRHYLLDRYLIRRQISFDAVPVIDTQDSNIPDVFGTEQAHGVVTMNPFLSRLITQGGATTLFDSRQIPNEILELVVVRRNALLDNPDFPQVLLSIWFDVMNRLQGNQRDSILNNMSNIANMSRAEFDQQMATIVFSSTSTEALSAIRRDRVMRKAMRHIRYFIERHDLIGNAPFVEWVSYPGRSPALLHFNARPLQRFVAPQERL
jgi:NitT/TauT family transport system substrate-binding protein